MTMKMNKPERGSVLITTMIFTTIIGISLATYLSMSKEALNLSQRSFYNNAAMNLVEGGMEQAFWSLNNNSWAGWTVSGGNATNTFSGFNYAGNATGLVKVCVENYANSGAPGPVVAEGILTPGDPSNGGALTKMAYATISPRSLFALGIVARNGVKFSGNVYVDSWNSLPNGSGGATQAYSAAVADAKATVATTSVTADVSVGNGQINGYVSVAAGTLANITVGSSGYVGPFGQAGGTLNPAYVKDDFVDNLTVPTAPSPTTVNTLSAVNLSGSNTLSLPGAADHPNAADGVYYYSIPSVSGSGNSSISIAPNSKVVWIVTAAAGSDAITASGNGGIVIPSGSTLTVYTAGNVTVSGGGVLNANTQPRTFQLYGTDTFTPAAGQNPTQNITLSGNATLIGVAYAPNAAITLSGNAGTEGAVVGNSVTMSGNGSFHYDESLATMSSSGLYQPSQWSELASASDRANYLSLVSF